MSRLKFDVAVETLRLAEPFRISGFCFETAEVVYVTLDDGQYRGRGEAAGVYYMQDDLAHMTRALQQARPEIEAGPTRQQLRGILPPGALDSWAAQAAYAGRGDWEGLAAYNRR